MRDLHGPRGGRPRNRASTRLAHLGLGALVAGCVNNSGLEPPASTLDFPIAAVVSNYDPSGAVGPDFLFVANSNYDIRYDSGSLQAYSLPVALQAIEDQCVNAPTPIDPSDCQLLPEGGQADTSAAIKPIEVSGLIVSEVQIGSYADGIALSPDGTRLYLPVRSYADLTHVDVDPATGALACGPTSSCDFDHVTTDRSQADAQGLTLPSDPVALHVGPLSDLMGPGQVGNYVVMTHRIGAASLFTDDDPSGGSRPKLIDVLTNLPAEIVTTTLEPNEQLFWSSSAQYPYLSRIGIDLDATSASPGLATLFDAGSLYVTGINTGTGGYADTRDIAFDPRAGDDRAYIVSRRPASLLIANRTPDQGNLDLLDLVDVGPGPARVQIATFDVGGTTRLFAFVSCFDNRTLYVIDPDLRQLMAVVTELSGPYELQVDVVRRLIYVVDFRVSVIRIIDMAPMFDCLENPPSNDVARSCSPKLLGMIGQPIAPKVLQ